MKSCLQGALHVVTTFQGSGYFACKRNGLRTLYRDTVSGRARVQTQVILSPKPLIHMVDKGWKISSVGKLAEFLIKFSTSLMLELVQLL